MTLYKDIVKDLRDPSHNENNKTTVKKYLAYITSDFSG